MNDSKKGKYRRKKNESLMKSLSVTLQKQHQRNIRMTKCTKWISQTNLKPSSIQSSMGLMTFCMKSVTMIVWLISNCKRIERERERVWMLIGTRHSDRRFLHAYLLHVNHPKLSLTLFKRREKRMCLVGIWFDQVDLVETSKSNELTHRWEYDAFIRCKHYNIQEIGHLVNTVQIKH